MSKLLFRYEKPFHFTRLFCFSLLQKTNVPLILMECVHLCCHSHTARLTHDTFSRILPQRKSFPQNFAQKSNHIINLLEAKWVSCVRVIFLFHVFFRFLFCKTKTKKITEVSQLKSKIEKCSVD